MSIKARCVGFDILLEQPESTWHLHGPVLVKILLAIKGSIGSDR